MGLGKRGLVCYLCMDILGGVKKSVCAFDGILIGGKLVSKINLKRDKNGKN